MSTQAMADKNIKNLASALRQPSNKILMLRQAAETNSILKINLAEIKTDENIRKFIDSNSLEFKQLAKSIKRNGILQSIVVEAREVDHEKYELVCVAGHRRIAAAVSVGFDEKIPARIVQPNMDYSIQDIAISENILRKDLHFLDTAEVFRYLLEAENLNKKEIASRFSRDDKTVSRYLKMASWSDKVKDKIREHPELFSLTFVMHNWVQKTKSEKAILASINKKIEHSTNPDSVPKQKVTAKERRLSFVKKYFRERSISKDTQKEIHLLLEEMKLI